jgi:hypothetical protein
MGRGFQPPLPIPTLIKGGCLQMKPENKKKKLDKMKQSNKWEDAIFHQGNTLPTKNEVKEWIKEIKEYKRILRANKKG